VFKRLINPNLTQPKKQLNAPGNSLLNWLQGVATNDPARSIELLCERLKVFIEESHPPIAQIEMLEGIRKPVNDLINVHNRAYTDKALPLAEEEALAFERARRLLGLMQSSYLSAFQSLCGAGLDRDAATAFSLQRSCGFGVSLLIEHYRARQRIDDGIWDGLTAGYAAALALECQAHACPDLLHPTKTSSVRSTFGRAVLLSICQAGSMAQRNLDATLAIALGWEGYIDCDLVDGPNLVMPASESPQTPESAGYATMQRTGRVRVVRLARSTALLSTTRLAQALVWLQEHVNRREPVMELGLTAAMQADLPALLPKLIAAWCGAGDLRDSARHATKRNVSLACGLHAMYFLAKGTSFLRPLEFDIYQTGAFADRTGFYASARTLSPDAALALTGAIESWIVLDESESGMRMCRKTKTGIDASNVAANSASRLQSRQIVGVMTSSTNDYARFKIGEIRWVQQEVNAGVPEISTGIKFLAESYQPVVGRTYALIQGRFQEVEPCFICAFTAISRIIIPSSWYAPMRKIDIYDGRSVKKLMLNTAYLRGADITIASYDLIV
jgi:hypothetical protein